MTETASKIVCVILSVAKNLKTDRRGRGPYDVSFFIFRNMRVVEGAGPYGISFFNIATTQYFKFIVAFANLLCYNAFDKRINAGHRAVRPLSDARRDRALGDKGIAVKVRGNSHYRNSHLDGSSRNAYRSVTSIKVSRASGEAVCTVWQETDLFHSTPWRVLLFYPFVSATD